MQHLHMGVNSKAPHAEQVLPKMFAGRGLREIIELDNLSDAPLFEYAHVVSWSGTASHHGPETIVSAL